MPQIVRGWRVQCTGHGRTFDDLYEGPRRAAERYALKLFLSGRGKWFSVTVTALELVGVDVPSYNVAMSSNGEYLETRFTRLPSGSRFSHRGKHGKKAE